MSKQHRLKCLPVSDFTVTLETQEVLVKGPIGYDDLLAKIQKTGKEVRVVIHVEIIVDNDARSDLAPPLSEGVIRGFIGFGKRNMSSVHLIYVHYLEHTSVSSVAVSPPTSSSQTSGSLIGNIPNGLNAVHRCARRLCPTFRE